MFIINIMLLIFLVPLIVSHMNTFVHVCVHVHVRVHCVLLRCITYDAISDGSN